ncbi:unnamed protein product [Diabrotica balteata]|uniref:Uncharacterized protein n=1 Tax=Diabrotica balteata TaxID=107213 RepID=A0A9N9T7G7_DIABA|nr:unnamed protein product [Diabrotica balteata]
MLKQKKEQHLKGLNTKNTEDHQPYKETDRQLRKMIKQEKNKTWDQKCQEINTYIGGKQCTEVWNFIQSAKNIEKDKAHIHTIKPRQWKDHYESLLSELPNTVSTYTRRGSEGRDRNSKEGCNDPKE